MLLSKRRRVDGRSKGSSLHFSSQQDVVYCVGSPWGAVEVSEHLPHPKRAFVSAVWKNGNPASSSTGSRPGDERVRFRLPLFFSARCDVHYEYHMEVVGKTVWDMLGLKVHRFGLESASMLNVHVGTSNSGAQFCISTWSSTSARTCLSALCFRCVN